MEFISEILSMSCNSMLVANLLYTARVVIVGGGIVFYLSRFLRNCGWSTNLAYWVSVFCFAQVAFQIDLHIFRQLFAC